MKIQDYYHEELVSMANERFTFPFEKISFTYVPVQKSRGAALNFHLTNLEKKDIQESLYAPDNDRLFLRLANVGRRPGLQ
jgi:hypothetical protein